MKRFMIAFLSVLTVSLLLGFVILFEGNADNFSIWWKEKTRNSEGLPGSPYNERRVDSDEVLFEKSNKIEFIDKHGVKNFANSFIGTLFHEENRESNRETIQKLNGVVLSTDKTAVIETTKGMRDRESYETVVSESEKPFLFVVGKNDQAVPLDLSLFGSP